MWSQTEDEDSDGLLTSDIHESVDNPAVGSPDASLGSHRSKQAEEAPCLSVQRALRMITGHQEHFDTEKHNRFKMWLTNLFSHVATETGADVEKKTQKQQHKLADQSPHHSLSF